MTTGNTELTTDMLNPPIRRMFGAPNAYVIDWSETPLSGSLNPGTLRISRISGTAAPEGVPRESSVSFSMVMKVQTEIATGIDPSHRAYWKREALAYSSGLLAYLPGGIRTPECYGVEELSDTVARIWLEDLGQVNRHQWSMADYERAAHLLGRLNGSPLPAEFEPHPAWWSGNSVREWFEMMDGWVPQLESARNDPVIGPLWSEDSARYLSEIQHVAPCLLALLDELPLSFSHGDAHAGNLILSEPGSEADAVLFDWSDMGLRPLGADLYVLPQVAAMMHRYDADALAEVDEVMFASYLNGLAEADWSGDAREVRRGFAAACVIRSYVLAEVLLADPERRVRAETAFGAAAPELLGRMRQIRLYTSRLIRELDL